MSSKRAPDASDVADLIAFEARKPPDPLPPLDVIRARRREDHARKRAAHDAAKLIPVAIKADGPIGILHMGDPHVDDDGTDLALIERHVELIRKTPGLFGANVGDLRNNWIGRLSYLWSQQTTSAQEAVALAEWLVRSVEWLYLVGGNHDAWSGDDDPVRGWMRESPGIYLPHAVRLALHFPNGREVRINARHDFRGHSMWNTAHGVSKAAQMGWRDHVLTCGHKHVSGYAILKCPATGLISHAIRAASYKIIDGYAIREGLPDQNVSPAVVTIIDPTKGDDSPGLVTVLWDVEAGADFLRFLRRRK